MAYLFIKDYLRQIQQSQLNQITGSDTQILQSLELTAIEEANSYLVQKYDTAWEFTDIEIFSMSVAYKAQRRVYLYAADYVATNNYVNGNLVANNGKVYLVTGNKTGAWNTTNTSFLGDLYQIFNVKTPHAVWDTETQYQIGNQVWWHDKVYTCANSNYGIAPDDPQAAVYWGAGTTYSLTAGTLPTDTTKWNAADNRSQQLVVYIVNIALYYLHKRIAPQNIPANVVLAYDNAIQWMMMAAGANTGITANIPRIQPKVGYRTRMSSVKKNTNHY